jgi:hypothetical protein
MFKRIKDLFNPKFEINVSRCRACKRAYSDFRVYKGMNCDCGSNQHSPTNPYLIEKIKIIFLYIIRGY